MQDLKKNRRKVMNKQVEPVEDSVSTEEVLEEVLEEDMSRGVNKSKHHHGDSCECNHEHHHHHHDNCGCDHGHSDCQVYECTICNCKPKHDDCEPCGVESAENCFDNKCGPECCSPITPQKLSTSNSIPYAIETNRVFDTMAFQVFTDATAPNGEPLTFDIEVVEVNGPVPKSGQVNVTIEKVCVNSTGTIINTGVTSLEDFDIDPSTPMVGGNCETVFEYDVCGERNSECCRRGKGTSVSYKQKGLTITVEDLVLELRGKCGCTKFVALAYPAVKERSHGCCKCRVDDVEFTFNTLSAPICLPSDGRSVVLRQEYKTNLTVDCIGKAFLSCNCDCEYELCIPNDIDVVLCVQEVVSTLISEQIVVLGAANPIEPRVVDTFSQICDFPICGPNSREEGRERKNCRDKHCDC